MPKKTRASKIKPVVEETISNKSKVETTSIHSKELVQPTYDIDDELLNLETDAADEQDINSHMQHKASEYQDSHNSQVITEAVVKYVGIDNIIREKEKELKELKNQKKPKEEQILSYLEQSNVDEICITDGSLKKNKTQTKSSLTPEIIKEALSEKISNEEDVNALLNRIDELRSKTTKVNLKRVNK